MFKDQAAMSAANTMKAELKKLVDTVSNPLDKSTFHAQMQVQHIPIGCDVY